MPMQDSRTFTTTAPAAVNDGTPTAKAAVTIVKHAQSPTRVLVRNISFGNSVWVSHSQNELDKWPVGSGSFEIPPGMSEEFICAPGQGLYVISDGEDTRVSCAISDALPDYAR